MTTESFSNFPSGMTSANKRSKWNVVAGGNQNADY